MTGFERAVDELIGRGAGRMLPDLARITRMADLLGDPQLAYPSVHVTGTNGKGSVVRMVSALLAAAGLTPGTYTSPHLQTIRERLTLAGRHISERVFAAVYDEVAPLAGLVDAGRDDPGDHVTFFELLTAMAYWWFAEAPVDVGVFEVGMGGTWDATNLVRGEVAVINVIDVDHRELGATPAEVAAEKAGIVKAGAQVVSAAQPAGALAVIERAVAESGASLWLLGRDVEVASRRPAVGGQLLSLRVGERVVDDIMVPLFGAHQARNAALALAAFAAFLEASFDRVEDELIRRAFLAVAVPGRLEVVRRNPTVVLDGAHNPGGAAACAAAVAEAFDFRNLVLVVACLADKDVAGILAALRDRANHVVVTQAPSPRAMPVAQMAALAETAWAGTGVIVETATDVTAAMTKATGVAGDGDGVLVAGSLHTVGAARDLYLPPVDSPDDVIYPPEDGDGDDDAAFEAALDRMLGDVDRERQDRDGPDGRH